MKITAVRGATVRVPLERPTKIATRYLVDLALPSPGARC